jgi:hypothetical protein
VRSRPLARLVSAVAVALVLAGFASPVSGHEHDGRLWLVSVMEGRFAEKLGWWAELQPRWRNEGDEFDQLIVRPAVNYRLTPASSVWLGYADVITVGDRRSSHERRLWQQLLLRGGSPATVSLQSRTRLEQRWVDTGDDVGHRARQLVRLAKPTPWTDRLDALFWDEAFVSFEKTDWGALRGFDQNRAFAGVAFHALPMARVEIGYLNQFVRARGPDRMNHVASLSLFLDFHAAR